MTDTAGSTTELDAQSTDDEGARLVKKWVEEIKLYEKEYEPWEKKAANVVKRYADERNTKNTSKRRYNILWSNIQTLLPALYFSAPKANCERRFKDKDPVGLEAAEVLERATNYYINESLFHDNARNAVLDRLLGGRGTLWIRYKPHFKDAAVKEQPDAGPEITDEADGAQAEQQPAPQELEYEEVLTDYVHYRDFGHMLARTWSEVTAVWRKVYLTKDELEARFGAENVATVPLDHTPHEDEQNSKTQQPGTKATIYEIWDKTKKQVIWLHKDHPAPLDILDDPLGLKDFFPCPRPLYATLTTDSLVPTPDYLEYRDQAGELDEITARIALLTKSLKIVGVYDASAEGLQNFLAEGLENKLIPVKSWAMFAEKGGLKSAIEFYPIEMVANVVTALYEARDKIKSDLNEITGIADIIRGASDPSETAEAQHTKGQFATMRLSDMQNAVSMHLKEAVKIMAEVIAGHFSPETLAKITGQQLMTQQEKIMFQMQSQPQQQPMGMGGPPQPQQNVQGAQGAGAMTSPPSQQGASPPVPPPPAPPPGMDKPSWEDVMGLLKNKAALCFKIDIETDSTIKSDQDEERNAAVDFAKMVGDAVQGMSEVHNPALIPLMGQVLMFAVRKFKNARSLEQVFEETIEKIENSPPPPPPPDPRLQIAQMQIQAKQQENAQNNQAQAQREQVKYQNDQQMALGDAHAEMAATQIKEQAATQREQQKLSVEQQMTAFKEKNENDRAALDAKLDIILAHLDHQKSVALEKMKPPPISRGSNGRNAQ